MGGRFCSLDQTLSESEKYFSGNYVFPSLKMSEDQKKRSSPKIEEFLSPKSSEDQKKGLHCNLGLHLAGICWIYAGSFSSVQPALKPRREDADYPWRMLNLDGGMPTLDGEMHSPLQFKNCP